MLSDKMMILDFYRTWAFWLMGLTVQITGANTIRERLRVFSGSEPRAGGIEVAAYVMVENPDEPKTEEEGCVYASEYAGSRPAILGSVNRILEEVGAKRIVFHLPGYDRELLAGFREMGIRLEPETLPGHTFKIANPVRLMDRLRPYFEERIGPRLAADLSWHQDAGQFSLKLHGESLALSRDLERLVLGPNSKLEPGSGTRFPGFIGSLFPVPFPWPGLNGS